MKLVRFDAGAGEELGVFLENSVVSLTRAVPAWGEDMMTLIAQWDVVEAEVRRVAGAGVNTFAVDAVQLRAPIKRPGKIMAIGLNYADHIAESAMATPKYQTWFAKAATSANGPFDPIALPGDTPRVDYEAELVAVIGHGGLDIAASEARKAIFGYCVGNDVTERGWQHRTPQWTLGKSFDTHAPFGPWITTTDEIPDPHSLEIRCLVNDVVRQQSNTRHLVFDVWHQVAHLSQAMTLEPGDLIFTGTPGGIGAAMKPMQFLQPGDRVRVEIDSLGAIENVCAPRS